MQYYLDKRGLGLFFRLAQPTFNNAYSIIGSKYTRKPIAINSDDGSDLAPVKRLYIGDINATKGRAARATNQTTKTRRAFGKKDA
jgi:hypothetical protein